MIMMENTTTARDKTRSKNFKESEVKLLLDLVEKNKSVVECKKTDLVSTREKEACWQKIVLEFNNASGIYYRDLKILKSKYENLKKITKRKFADEKRYVMGTGGGPSMKTPDFSEVDIKIKDIVGDLVLSGHVSKFDSDVVNNDLTQLEIEMDNQDVTTSWDYTNMPVVLEEEVVEYIAPTGHSKSPQRFQGFIVSQATITDEIEPDGNSKPTSNLLLKVQDSPNKRRTEESSTAVSSIPKTVTPAKHTAFTMRDLSTKTSSPLLIGKRKKKSALDSSMAGKKIDGISDAKKEVMDLQKELYEKQIHFLEEEHLLKAKYMKEEHTKKQRLLDLKIERQELELKLLKENQ